MEIQGTEHQISFGLALASFSLAVQTIAAAVKRGDMTMADATALFGDARRTLHIAGQTFDCDPVVKQIAENALRIVERTTAAYSAETPPEGPH